MFSQSLLRLVVCAQITYVVSIRNSRSRMNHSGITVLRGTPSDPLDGGVPRPTGPQPLDWLFSSSPTSCVLPNFDNTPSTLASRIFLPIQFAALMCLIVFFGKQRDTDESLEEGSRESKIETISQEAIVRRYDLDFARIVCVGCVIVEHSGGSEWTHHNVMFVLQWVLPYLFLTSGIAFVMSKKDCVGYASRLVGLLLVGVMANWLADMKIGRDWRGDFGNTVFQMFYVVMLLTMSFAAAPLRHALQHRAKNPRAANDWMLQIPTLVFGLMTFVAMVLFVFPSLDGNLSFNSRSSWLDQVSVILSSAPIFVMQVGGLFFLCHLACLYQANGILPWLLLVHIYLPRVFIPWEKVGFFHNMELFIFAMVAESWSVKGRDDIVKCVRNYWPIMAFFCALLCLPALYGRCDLLPPNFWLERLRFYSIELMFALCLCLQAFSLGDPYNVTSWLSKWALFAYCFHVAFARIMPIPYGAVTTFSFVIVFYLVHLINARKEKEHKAMKNVNAAG
jgi:hypothetical protein